MTKNARGSARIPSTAEPRRIRSVIFSDSGEAWRDLAAVCETRLEREKSYATVVLPDGSRHKSPHSVIPLGESMARWADRVWLSWLGREVA